MKIWIHQVRVKVGDLFQVNHSQPGLFPTTLTCHGISKDLTPPIITVVSMRLGVAPKRSFSFGFAKNDFGGCYSTQIFSSNVEKGPISKGNLGGGFKYLLCSSKLTNIFWDGLKPPLSRKDLRPVPAFSHGILLMVQKSCTSWYGETLIIFGV